MKTWEMIKELTENPEKKFKRVGDQLEVSVDIDDCLLWKSGHSPFNINHVWEEVKQPVTFMEMLKVIEDTRRKDMRFTLEHHLIRHNNLAQAFTHKSMYGILKVLCQEFNDVQIALIITAGKWYIED